MLPVNRCLPPLHADTAVRNRDDEPFVHVLERQPRRIGLRSEPWWMRSAAILAYVLCHCIVVAPTVHGQGPPATVEIDKVVLQTLVPKQNFVGTSRPSRRTTVGSAVDGRVERFPIDAGQQVNEGTELAGLRIGTVSIQVEAAKAQLELYRAELEELKNGSRPEEIAKAEAQLKGAAALEDYFSARLRRTSDLARQSGTISIEELERAKSDFFTAEQSRIEAEANLKLLRDGPRAEQIARALAQVKFQEEQVNLLEDRRKKFEIKAPFDGFIVREHTEAGAWIQSGDPIADIVDLDPIEIEIQVPEHIIRYLSTELEAVVVVEAFAGTTYSGKINNIVPDADERTRTFPVKVHVANPHDANLHDSERPFIRSGMLARVSLPVSEPVTGLTVHKDALVYSGPEAIVFVNDNGVAKPVPVKVIVSDGLRSAVKGDLQEGDEVVTRGNERLRPGQALKIKT